MRQISKLVILCALAAAAAMAQQTTSSSDSAWKPVEQAMGRSGQVQPDGAMKFGLPRSDLKVVLGGVQIKPALALGGWVAFSSSSQGMVMGDLVLSDDEVAPVMSELERNGIAVTALHNHLLHETPHVMYMHIAGHGDATTLAHGVHDAVALTKIPPAPAAPQARWRNRAPKDRCDIPSRADPDSRGSSAPATDPARAPPATRLH